jgi:hypothetical protein
MTITEEVTAMTSLAGEQPKLTNYFLNSDNSWKPYAEKTEFIQYVSPIGGIPIDEKVANVDFIKLPFYKDVILVRILIDRHAEMPEYFFFARVGKEFILINGDSNTFFEINRKAGFEVNEDTVLEYLKFFCLFLMTEEGSFFIIEGPESEFIADRSGYDRDRVLKGYDGAMIEQVVDNSRLRVSARVLHGNGYYDSLFSVYKDGAIEMEQDVFLFSA